MENGCWQVSGEQRSLMVISVKMNWLTPLGKQFVYK